MTEQPDRVTIPDAEGNNYYVQITSEATEFDENGEYASTTMVLEVDQARAYAQAINDAANRVSALNEQRAKAKGKGK